MDVGCVGVAVGGQLTRKDLMAKNLKRAKRALEKEGRNVSVVALHAHTLWATRQVLQGMWNDHLPLDGVKRG